MMFLTQQHWEEVLEVIPNVSNAIQQTSSVVDGSTFDLALFVLMLLLPQLCVPTPCELLLVTPFFDLAFSASITGR